MPIPEGYAHKEHRTKGDNDLENTVKLSFALEELRSNFPDLMKKFSSPDKKVSKFKYKLRHGRASHQVDPLSPGLS